MPYRDQMIDETATVIARLEQAGAVHLAKVSLGALAWGDVWFKARTNSPWNTEMGASGSSAGSSAGVAAGFAAFAIGSETYGSIVSPATPKRSFGTSANVWSGQSSRCYGIELDHGQARSYYPKCRRCRTGI